MDILAGAVLWDHRVGKRPIRAAAVGFPVLGDFARDDNARVVVDGGADAIPVRRRSSVSSIPLLSSAGSATRLEPGLTAMTFLSTVVVRSSHVARFIWRHMAAAS
jgi:hypothetical protein